MPTPTLAHLNSDQLLDIAYINAGANGLGQMNIHFQQTSGFREQADWQSDLDSSGQLQLIDMNSDGLADICACQAMAMNGPRACSSISQAVLISLRPIRSCASQVTT